jgi:hypothetical protein
MVKLSLGSKLIYQFEPGSWAEAVFDVVIGTLTGTIRAFYIISRWAYVSIVRPVANLVGIHLPEGKRPKVDDGKLKVAAVGFSRTGTVSCNLVFCGAAIIVLAISLLSFICM